MAMSGSKFENETPFLSLAAIVGTGDGWDGTNFNIRDRIVSAVEMPGNRLVSIVFPEQQFPSTAI